MTDFAEMLKQEELTPLAPEVIWWRSQVLRLPDVQPLSHCYRARAAAAQRAATYAQEARNCVLSGHYAEFALSFGA